MTAYTFEPEDNSRLFLTVFCIGTPGIVVADYVYGVGIRDIKLAIAHTDRAQLMGSYVETKLWYEPGPDTDLTDELTHLIGNTPLTAVVVDLQGADDRALAQKTIAVLIERNAFYIVVLPIPDSADELAWASVAYLQQQPGSLLVSQPADTDPAALISPLTHSVYNLCHFCDILYTYDLPAIRAFMPSPGRLVICTGQAVGDNRVEDAFADLKRYLHTQPFDCARASQLHLQIGVNEHESVEEAEITNLMVLVAGLTTTEPNQCSEILVLDRSLGQKLQLTLLLWYPTEPGESGTT